jgi:hypothetical protein
MPDDDAGLAPRTPWRRRPRGEHARMTRGRALLLLVLPLLLVGCVASRRGVALEEIEVAAWWVEDVAHGRARDPAELVAENASDGLLRIARWARGADAARPELPAPIARRRERWPALAALIRDGVVAVDPATRALTPVRGSEQRGERALAESLVRDENGDRGAVDYTMLTLGRADDAGARRYRATARAARVRWDGSPKPR